MYRNYFYVIFTILVSLNTQNYAMEIILTEETKENYNNLCRLIRKTEKEKLQNFQKKLPLENSAEKIDKIERKLENIKKNLSQYNADIFLEFKKRFNLDDQLWDYCILTAVHCVRLENGLSSTPLDDAVHNPSVPDSLMGVLKKQLEKKGLNPQRFSISLNNNDMKSLRSPMLQGTVSSVDYTYKVTLNGPIFPAFPGKILLPSSDQHLSKKHQKTACMIIAYILSTGKSDFIIGNMLLTYKPFFGATFTADDIPNSHSKAPLHIALIKQKYAHMILEYATHYSTACSSSNDYLLLAKIVRYWNMLTLLQAK